MILLIDNYDSFTYNLAQYIGNFAEVQVLRNDDPKLYEEAEKADGLVFSPGPGWPVDAGKMEDMIRDFAAKKPILGICLGHQAIAEVFGGKLGLAPKVMHGKQSNIRFEAPSVLYQDIDCIFVCFYYFVNFVKFSLSFISSSFSRSNRSF